MNLWTLPPFIFFLLIGSLVSAMAGRKLLLASQKPVFKILLFSGSGFFAVILPFSFLENAIFDVSDFLKFFYVSLPEYNTCRRPIGLKDCKIEPM